MADAETRRGTQPIAEIDVLWITAGLGCDGDTIAMTAATQPSIEDLVPAPCPGFPKSTSTIPSWRMKMATSSSGISTWRRRTSWPFILVIEGSIPNENNKAEGYWAAFGTDPKTGQPITTCEWIDRLAPKAWAVIAAGTCATYGGIHAWKAIRPAAWGFRIIWAGSGGRRRTFPSFACRDVRCSRTISWRRCCICFIWRRGGRP